MVYLGHDGASAHALKPRVSVMPQAVPKKGRFFVHLEIRSQAMIAVMQPSATAEDIEHVVEVLRLHNLKALHLYNAQRYFVTPRGPPCRLRPANRL